MQGSRKFFLLGLLRDSHLLCRTSLVPFSCHGHDGNPSPPNVNDVQASPLAPSTLEGCATFGISVRATKPTVGRGVTPQRTLYPPSMVAESRLSPQELMHCEDAWLINLSPIASRAAS